MDFGCDSALRKALSDALCNAVSEYVAFAATPLPEKSSDQAFAARHAAGKNMVGHIAVLAKLVHWWSAAGDGAAAKDGGAVPDMVAAARSAVSGYAADDD